MTVTHSKIPARYKRQRGVATILVISSLLVLTLIGFALISIVQFQRMSGNASGLVIAREDATKISVETVKTQIQKDLLDYYRGVDASGATSNAANATQNTAGRAVTYPSDYQPWLASTEPQNSDLTAFTTWPHISKLGKFTDSYVNWRTLANTDTLQDNLTFSFRPAPVANPNTPHDDQLYADTDGDGWYDAKWELLSNFSPSLGITNPSTDGLTWVQATRIIDNSSLLNVNTVAVSYGNYPGTETPTGRTPADVCFYYPYSKADLSAATWSPAPGMLIGNFLPTATPTDNGSLNWAAFFQAKGDATIPNTVASRKGFWDNYGSRQNQLFRVGNPGTPLAASTPLGFADEIELRFKSSKNLANRSFLESVLDTDRSVSNPNSSQSGPLRSYSAESNVLNAAQIKADRRRLLTVLNGTNTILVPTSQTNAATAQYREPMPLWLSELNGVNAPSITFPSAFTPPQGVPNFKLNPNTDDASWLGYVFELILRQNSYLNARYGAESRPDYPRATDTAYMLGANLARYRLTNAGVPYNVSNPQTYDPIQAQVTSPHGITYYGLGVQPFFTMVAYSEVFADPGDDGEMTTSAELPWNQGATSPKMKFFAVELRNPFPVPVDLSQFAIRYNGTTMNITGSTRWLNPGDYVIVHTDNANWAASFSTSAPAGNRIAIVMTNHNAAFPPNNSALGDGIFELVSTASPTIPIDRIQHVIGGVVSTTWMRPAAGPGPGATYPIALPATGSPSYNFFQTLCFLQRWWSYDGAAPSSTATSNGYAQSYMLENSAGNNTANPLPNDSSTYNLGQYRVVAGTSGTAFTPHSDLQTAITARMGNSNPADVTTALAKLGSAPAGLTWPKFQVALKYDLVAAPATVSNIFNNVGEVFNLLTVSHTTTKTFAENLADRYLEVASPTNLVILNQPPLLNYGQFNNGRFSDGTTTDSVIRSSPPYLPVALCIPTVLDLLVSDATSNPSFVAGRINIGTAPVDVIEAMPYFYQASLGAASLPSNYYLARGVVAYRELLSLPSGPDYSGALGDANNRAVWTGVQATAGATVANRNLRLDKGFATPDELLMVRTKTLGAASDYAINYLALDTTNSPAAVTGPLDFTPDQVIDDVEEDSMVYNAASNIASTRSDVFTAYVVLRGVKPITSAPGSNYETKVERRYVATLLRGTILQTGSDATLASATSISGLTLTNPTRFIGKAILLKKKAGTGFASAMETLSGVITNATASTLTISLNEGLFYKLAPGPINPTFGPGWEYQIVDEPQVLSFIEAK